MPATWPGALAQVLDGSQFTYTFSETRQRTENQNGAAKLRRKVTKAVNIVQGKIVVTYSLYNTFKTFYDTTINGGVDTFTMTHPISGSTATFRFMSPPQITHLGGNNFNLQMVLEEMP